MDLEVLIRICGFAVVFAAMASWELLAPRRALAVGRRPRWASNLGILLIDVVAVRVLIPTAAVGAALFAAGRGWGLFHVAGLRLSAAAALGFLVLDLVIYGQHVLFHKVPALWRLHRMHHADLDIDVTTGVRFHPFEILLSMLIKIAVVIVFGIPVIAVLAFEVVLNATSMFNHANVRCPPRSTASFVWWWSRPTCTGCTIPFCGARPTAISVLICRGGTACSEPTGRRRRQVTTR